MRYFNIALVVLFLNICFAHGQIMNHIRYTLDSTTYNVPKITSGIFILCVLNNFKTNDTAEISLRINKIKTDSISKDNWIKRFFNKIFKKKQDSISIVSKILKNKNSGIAHSNIYLQYDYGYYPYFVSSEMPRGFASIGGNIAVNLLSLPFNVSGYYNELGNLNGTNNYFRFSFDANKYKESLVKKATYNLKAKESELLDLQKEKQALTQKLLYYQNLEQINKSKNDINVKNIFGNNSTVQKINASLPVKDSLTKGLNIENSDSLGTKKIVSNKELNKDTLNVKSFKVNEISKSAELDSLKSTQVNVKDLSKSYDSNEAKLMISEYSEKLKDLNKKIDEVETGIKFLKNPDVPVKLKSKSGNFLDPFFKGISKFEIGTSYPSYSTFLINGVGVSGINLEGEINDIYVGFTYGLSQDTRYYNNSNQYFLQKFANFFDYNNLSYGKRLTSFKIGYGKKEESHIHFGFLYGYGAEILYGFNSIEINQNRTEKNYVFEIDAKWVIDKNNNLDMVYGKSYISSQDSLNNKGLAGLFDFGTRSNALQLKYHTQFNVTKTKLALSCKLLDPLFRSYGVSSFKSDIFSYEIKADQTITKRIKTSIFYRSMEDNLLNLGLSKTRYQSLGSTTSLKLNKFVSIKGTYNPIFQKIKIEGMSNLIFNSYLANGVLNINIVKSTCSILNNVVLNYYNFYDGLKTNDFKSALLNNVITLGKIKNEFSAEWNKISSDTLNSDNLIVKNDFGFQINKINIVAGLKWGNTKEFKNQIGFKLKLCFPIYKNLLFELQGEKFLYGEFFHLSNELPNKLLYNIFGKMNYVF